MSSGVKVNDDCQQVFQKMQMDKKIPFIIFKLSDDNKEVVVDRVGREGECFTEFKDHMMNAAAGKESKDGLKDCRYAVFDVYDENDTGSRKLGKLLFCLWSDDHVGIKPKMLYTSSVQELKKKLVGIHKDIECHCEDELTLAAFQDKFGIGPESKKN